MVFDIIRDTKVSGNTNEFSLLLILISVQTQQESSATMMPNKTPKLNLTANQLMQDSAIQQVESPASLALHLRTLPIHQMLASFCKIAGCFMSPSVMLKPKWRYFLKMTNIGGHQGLLKSHRRCQSTVRVPPAGLISRSLTKHLWVIQGIAAIHISLLLQE